MYNSQEDWIPHKMSKLHPQKTAKSAKFPTINWSLSKTTPRCSLSLRTFPSTRILSSGNPHMHKMSDFQHSFNWNLISLNTKLPVYLACTVGSSQLCHYSPSSSSFFLTTSKSSSILPPSLFQAFFLWDFSILPQEIFPHPFSWEMGSVWVKVSHRGGWNGSSPLGSGFYSFLLCVPPKDLLFDVQSLMFCVLLMKKLGGEEEEFQYKGKPSQLAP